MLPCWCIIIGVIILIILVIVLYKIFRSKEECKQKGATLGNCTDKYGFPLRCSCELYMAIIGNAIVIKLGYWSAKEATELNIKISEEEDGETDVFTRFEGGDGYAFIRSPFEEFIHHATSGKLAELSKVINNNIVWYHVNITPTCDDMIIASLYASIMEMVGHLAISNWIQTGGLIDGVSKINSNRSYAMSDKNFCNIPHGFDIISSIESYYNDPVKRKQLGRIMSFNNIKEPKYIAVDREFYVCSSIGDMNVVEIIPALINIIVSTTNKFINTAIEDTSKDTNIGNYYSLAKLCNNMGKYSENITKRFLGIVACARNNQTTKIETLVTLYFAGISTIVVNKNMEIIGLKPILQIDGELNASFDSIINDTIGTILTSYGCEESVVASILTSSSGIRTNLYGHLINIDTSWSDMNDTLINIITKFTRHPDKYVYIFALIMYLNNLHKYVAQVNAPNFATPYIEYINSIIANDVLFDYFISQYKQYAELFKVLDKMVTKFMGVYNNMPDISEMKLKMYIDMLLDYENFINTESGGLQDRIEPLLITIEKLMDIVLIVYYDMPGINHNETLVNINSMLLCVFGSDISTIVVNCHDLSKYINLCLTGFVEFIKIYAYILHY